MITAGILARAGDLWLRVVIAAAAGGAIVGDNISYGSASGSASTPSSGCSAARRRAAASSGPSEQLEQRGIYIIVVARFIPGGRTAVTFSSGYTHAFPWRRFIVADIFAGLIWGTYAAMLGYFGGKTFEEQPWKGLFVGFVVAIGVAVGVEAIRWYIGKRAPTRGATPDGDAS